MKAVAALLCALLPPPPAPVHLTVDPQTLPLTTGQCNARNLSVRLTNTTDQPVYADAELSAPGALHLQRALVSTWLPPGHTTSTPVRVSAATGTPPGAYRVTVTSGDQHVEVPVTVTAPPPGAALARRAARVTATSFRAMNPVCAGADGDLATYWGDATNRSWPDRYQLDWDTGIVPGRVEVHTVPAERGGLRDWDVQIWSGDAWQTVGRVRGNTATSRTSTFTPQPTRAVRIVTLAGNGVNDQSRITEVTLS
jgi:hypothetical protein